MTTTLIIGCGYVGEKVALQLMQLESNHNVYATVGSSSKAATLTIQGIKTQAINFDAEDITALTIPREPYRLLYLVPPSREGEKDTRLQRVLNILQTRPPVHFVYMGTSGVYGDCQGDWVNESRIPNPTSEPSKRRLHAEKIVDRWSATQQCSRTLLRVSAIYGPERLPIKRIREGRPAVNADESAWSNRVHIEDLTTICIKALAREGLNEIFNVSDGHPTTSEEFISTIARALGMPLPSSISLKQALCEATPAQRIYLTESRRLDNRLLLQKLDLRLRFPTIDSAIESFSTAKGTH